jgi:CheY-like chemotaxis protein
MEKVVLLVEDDATLRALGKAQLKYLGVQCEVATDGVQAVKFALERKYDLILMDIGLPEIDGINAAMQIRENEMRSGKRRAIIVACTAFPNVAHGAPGMDGYLLKPVLIDALSSVLHKWGILPNTESDRQ